MDYQVTIGIEIHCALQTKTKMFSPAAFDFNDPVNSCVHQNDLAMPGVLPVVNQKAVEYALKTCHGLHMSIDPLVRFDRKNYFYADLPKGFQITQQFHPLGKDGYLMIYDGDVGKKIRINRLHMEEDTAKQFHEDDFSLIDFNRAGVSLIEIVSEPDLKSAKEAALYVATLRQLLLYLQVSDVKMEQGSLRCDVNISLAKPDAKQLGVKVEVKNLNSISNVQLAIEAEIKRQKQCLDNNQPIIQATYRFDEKTNTTVMMRKKETAVDYKFFPEPNILPILLDKQWILDIKEAIGLLPQERIDQYVALGIERKKATILVNQKELADFFDTCLTYKAPPVLMSNYLISEVLGVVSENFAQRFEAKQLAQLVCHLDQEVLSSKQAKQILPLLIDRQATVSEVVAKKNLVQISDPKQIEAWILHILDKHPQVVVDFKNGKDHAVKFVMGQVMKLSKGQANPKVAMQQSQAILKKQ